jgi:hypothetical protein
MHCVTLAGKFPMEVDLVVALVCDRQPFMHQTQKRIHPLQHSLDLKHLDRVLQVREVNLQEFFGLRIPLQFREPPVALGTYAIDSSRPLFHG